MTSNSAASYSFNLTIIQPCVTEVKARMAIRETINTIIPCQILVTPIRSNSGLKIKTTGNMAVRISYLNA